MIKPQDKRKLYDQFTFADAVELMFARMASEYSLSIETTRALSNALVAAMQDKARGKS